LSTLAASVHSGSWLCKNAKTLNRDRRSYSSKTALVVQLASEFNLEVELKNIILVAFRFFEFLHSQGQTRTSSMEAARPLPPSADIGPGGQSVGQAAQFCLGRLALQVFRIKPVGEKPEIAGLAPSSVLGRSTSLIG
jgi:hypothetical protein